jgi:hypothetical protein
LGGTGPEQEKNGLDEQGDRNSGRAKKSEGPQREPPEISINPKSQLLIFFPLQDQRTNMEKKNILLEVFLRKKIGFSEILMYIKKG